MLIRTLIVIFLILWFIQPEIGIGSEISKPRGLPLLKNSGQAIVVSPDGTLFGDGSSDNPFPTLARGIAASSPAGGDTILLKPGKYYEQLTVRTPVILRAESTDSAVIGQYPPNELYSRVNSTQTRPSNVFCGNLVKSPNGVCTSKATTANGNRPAWENTEIRGWVISCCGDFGDPTECTDPNFASVIPCEELRFGLMLDYGWESSTPNDEHINPINTIEKINSVITPFNVISFGGASRDAASSQLDSDHKVWGGAAAMVIHIEVNGWYDKGRMAGIPPPNDWHTIGAPQTKGVFWAFDPQNPASISPRSLQDGDYVRLVGTLWEDEPHIHDGSSEQKDAKGCWNTGVADQGGFGRGWFELHPVDYEARIYQPPPHTDNVEVIAICNESAFSTQTTSFTRNIAPLGPRPSPQSTIGFEVFYDNDFTVWRSVITDNVTVKDDHIEVEMKLETGSWWGHQAKFKATYRVFWK